MAIAYYPINGYAGKVSIRVYDYEDEDYSSTISFYVVDFSESNEDSEYTELFTNINDELIKDYRGYRKVISFSIVNAPFDTGRMIDETNITNIIKLATYINIVQRYPSIKKLEIVYRSGEISSIIDNAILIGEINLQEISKNANAGQIIPLTFKSKNVYDIEFAAANYITGISFENEDSIFVTEDELENLIMEIFN